MNKFALVICLAAACGGSQVKPLPAFYTVSNVDNPRYPQRQFVAAVGISTLSAEVADKRAMANVSAAISAQLQSETSSFQQYSSVRGDTRESITSRVSVRTSFDRADLIRVVDRSPQREAFYAYAVLDRTAADQELAAASSADLSSFNAAAASASGASAQDAGVFAVGAAEAGKLRQKLDASFIVRRAILGKPAADEAGYVQLRNQLLAMMEQHRARRVVGVVLKSGGSPHLSDFTVNAVKRLGLRPDSASCDKRDRTQLTDATELSVQPEESCSEGSLGERCDVVVHLVAQSCAGGTTGAGTVALVRGVNPTDRDKARRAAWEKVTPALVEAAVRDALKSAIQLGE